MGIVCARPIDPLGATIPRGVKLDASPIVESGLPIIFLTGAPGSGKLTQYTEITQHYDFCGIITREVLREDISTGSQRGIILAYLMSEAKLIPEDIMVEFIKKKMLNNLHGYRGFIISGFPKEKVQSKYFDKNIRPPDLVLYLLVRTSLLMDRLVGRTIIITERYGRNFEHMKMRIKEYNKMINPALTYYSKKLIIIDGEKEVSEVFSAIRNAIDELLTRFPNASNVTNADDD